jgi:uncharacterized protein (DUF488 family)
MNTTAVQRWRSLGYWYKNFITHYSGDIAVVIVRTGEKKRGDSRNDYFRFEKKRNEVYIGKEKMIRNAC